MQAWSFATRADAERSLREVPGLLRRAHELLLPATPLDGTTSPGRHGHFDRKMTARLLRKSLNNASQ